MQYHRARWYDPNTGRFTAMDPFSGDPTRPATLHKYVYANNDPVNVIDPSGRFGGLAETGAASSIASTLSNFQVDFGFNFISAKLDGDDYSDSSMGWAALASMAPMAVASIAKKALTVTSKMGKVGKVAYLSAKKPLDKEIRAAEFLSERFGVGIYIRGGNSTKGADFFINGQRWELKTLDEATNEAVKNSIKKALKQSNRVVIDGRDAGLTETDAIRGVARAAGVGKEPDSLMIILGNDKVLTWP